MINCVRSGDEMADSVLVNGSLWTANSTQPWAEAVAIDGDRILAVGRTAEIKRLASKKTKVIDLNGALVLPGFIDSHTHFLEGGFSLSSIQLRDVTSRERFVKRVEEKAQGLGKGEWILQGNWDHEQFSPPELPRREWIDGVSPQNPVCVSRYDLHIVLANSLALEIGGITKKTESPQGGEIQKDPETGEPTGILRDAAIDLVMRHIPKPSLKANLEAAEAALRHARELGVTSLNDMADESSFAACLEVYQELLREGELTARVHLYIPIDEMDLVEQLRLKTPFGNDWLAVGGLKGFSDGGLGASTAYFFEPYTDNPNTSGLLAPQMFPEGIMEKRVLQADKAGLQVAIHAIGDKANSIILNIFAKTLAQNGKRDRRWRIEHAQHLRPEDIGRFSELGVIASVQPFHAIDDGRWAEAKIGKERCRTTYAFKSLLDSGATLALGSDWPVAPLNPLVGIYAAVTRRTTDGKNPDGWFPEEKISLDEAIKGFTLNGAYAEFSERIKGSLEVGKLADLVVLDQNLFKIAPEKIKDARVTLTVVGGKIVYDRSENIN
jgi:predicted amidohydrolase YtcJ